MRAPTIVLALSLGIAASCGGPSSTSSTAGDNLGARIEDPLGFLPIEAEAVIGIDFAQVRASTLWADMSPKLMATPGMDFIVKKCGFDPIASVQKVRIAWWPQGEYGVEGVAVVTGVDRDRLITCATSMATSERSIVVNNGVIEGSDGGTPKGMMGFADASTAVIRFGAGVTQDSLRAALATAAPLRTRAPFAAVLAAVDTKATVWGMANGAAEVVRRTLGGGLKPSVMFGSAVLAGGLTGSAHMRMEVASDAAAIASKAQGGLAAVQAFVQSITVTAEAGDVVAKASLTEAQLASLASMINL